MQCKKSFKERNPDVDMDAIQRNPNVPDDVKAAINGAFTLDEGLDIHGNAIVPAAPKSAADFLDLDSYDNDFSMGYGDGDAKKLARKRLLENDALRKKTNKHDHINQSLMTPKKMKCEPTSDSDSESENSSCQNINNRGMNMMGTIPANFVKPDKYSNESAYGSSSKATATRKQNNIDARQVAEMEKPVSSLENMLRTIETVVLGLDETSRDFRDDFEAFTCRLLAEF